MIQKLRSLITPLVVFIGLVSLGDVMGAYEFPHRVDNILFFINVSLVVVYITTRPKLKQS